jgi:hypothetical protein
VFSGILYNKSRANLYKLDTFLEAVLGCLPEVVLIFTLAIISWNILQPGQASKYFFGRMNLCYKILCYKLKKKLIF